MSNPYLGQKKTRVILIRYYFYKNIIKYYIFFTLYWNVKWLLCTPNYHFIVQKTQYNHVFCQNCCEIHSREDNVFMYMLVIRSEQLSLCKTIPLMLAYRQHVYLSSLNPFYYLCFYVRIAFSSVACLSPFIILTGVNLKTSLTYSTCQSISSLPSCFLL